MKRTIEFNFQENEYFLQEEGNRIFTIKATDLKFNSIDFYNGLYKNKSANIVLINKIVNDPLNKGEYIFSWLSEIISEISKEFAEEETMEEDSPKGRVIPLFEFSACAGDGFFIDDNIPHTDIEDSTGCADYAVTISGNSMEPTIMDNSVIFVKKEEEPEHKEVGLFVVDGNVMCKRYVKQGRGYKLVPDNSEHKTISGKDISSIAYLGKVIL